MLSVPQAPYTPIPTTTPSVGLGTSLSLSLTTPPPPPPPAPSVPGTNPTPSRTSISISSGIDAPGPVCDPHLDIGDANHTRPLPSPASSMLDISTDTGSGPSSSRRSSVLSIQRFRRSPSFYSTSSTTSSSSSSVPMDPINGGNGSGSGSRSRSKEGMSDAALVDREWEETDWERVKTLPTVYLTPPEGMSPDALLSDGSMAKLITYSAEENSGPVALYPLLPPLPPPPPGSVNPGGPGVSNQWGGMAKGFVQPPPVFARSRGGRAGVIMPKTRDELAAEARSRRIRLAEVEDKRLSYPPPPPLTSTSTAASPDDGGGLLSTGAGSGGLGEDRMPPVAPSQVMRSDERRLLVSIEPEPSSPALTVHGDDVDCAPMTTSSSTSWAPSSSTSRRTSPPTRQLPLPPPESPESSVVSSETVPTNVTTAPSDAPSLPNGPPPPPPTTPPMTETSTAIKPRSRKRTFSLTSLLASRSQKSSSSSDENIPPVPAIPPVIRKHKSLKQLFTPTPSTTGSTPWTTPVPIWSPTPTRRTTEPRVSGFAHAHPPPSRIGKRFSLSNLSSSFKRPYPGQGLGQEEVPPVPLLPVMYRQDEVISRHRQEHELEVTPDEHRTDAMPLPQRQTLVAPPTSSGEDVRSLDVEPERQPTPPAPDPPRSSSSHEDRRERSESGCSVSTLSSSASQTCRNLTHVSPRTQRNPSASLALRQYIHDGPSVGTVTEITSTPQHRRYESLEATVILMERTDSTSGSGSGCGSSSEGHQTVIVTPVLPVGEVPPEMTMDLDEIRRQVPITRPPTKVVLDLEPEYEDVHGDEEEEEEMEEVYQDARESLESAPGSSRSARRQSTNTTTKATTTRTAGLRRFITLKRHSTGSTPAALGARSAPVEPPSTWTPTHGSHLKSLHFEGEGLGLDFERHDWTTEHR